MNFMNLNTMYLTSQAALFMICDLSHKVEIPHKVFLDSFFNPYLSTLSVLSMYVSISTLYEHKSLALEYDMQINNTSIPSKYRKIHSQVLSPLGYNLDSIMMT
ncbi:unnamed protein product [Owenia fusiformis]|uniref:Uncharacterized protein n=1 Tax=Owenia fusiformis TaxID=6347 RepID=A0A8J1XUG0_OWEFU|nr:unnamed protein product [Owenia fusiformis]